MGIVFAVRGNSTTARYSGGENTALEIPSAHTITSDAGALSGSYINMTTAGNRSCIWHALKNLPNGRPISILLRMRPSYSGAPSGIRGLFSIDSGIGASGPRMTFFHNVTDGAVKVIGTKTDNNATFNNVSFGNWTSNTSGTDYDLVFTWTGDTTSNGAKFYIDCTLLGQLTASNAADSAMNNLYYKAISLGSNTAVALAAMGVDEFVIWDSVIDPTSVALVGGTGSLNGASRTALVDVASFDGSAYTDPGAANVKTGTSYTFNGTSNTGTYDGSDRWTDPGESNVKTGVAYKANSTTNNKTGTYDGSDRWTDPGESNVRNGTAYKANSTTNNKTGTLVSPALSDVKTGVAGDGGTGTYDGSDRWTDPGETNVKTGTEYKANSTSNNKTGTYDGSDRWTDPGEDNVRTAVAYKANSTTNNKTGNLTLPPESKVEVDYQYGANAIEYTGTLEQTPTASEIADAVWNAAVVNHTTSGSFGVLVKKISTFLRYIMTK